MQEKLKLFEYLNFYEFFNDLSKTEKLLLRKNIEKYSRMEAQTVKNWISQKNIPFYKSNDVTKAVIQFAPVISLDTESITEKKLFPNYAHLIDSYT